MKKLRLGLTLIELVVVVAILGVLAAMLLPKFENLTNAVNHTAAGSSMTDVAKAIMTPYAKTRTYPNRWDSLTDGTALWQAASVGAETKGLHTQLVGSTGKLTLGVALTDAQVKALSDVGISTILNVPSGAATATPRAGDAFNTPVTITTGMQLAVINKASTGGIKIIDRIYRNNQLASPNGVSGAIASTPTNPTGDTAAQLIVFGLGPQSSLIPGSMMEAPTYAGAHATYVYNRLLVVFELTATKVTFKTVLGADGDLLDDLTVNMQTAAN